MEILTGKSLVVDTTCCTGCRGCQVACKQWFELPAETTVPTQRGTYENPSDLSATCWVIVTFSEAVRPDGSIAWNFLRHSCRHCVDAPCQQAAENPDSITIDPDTGAVLFGPATVKECLPRLQEACPWGVPREGADGQLYKCTMCNDRLHSGMLPACVQACPSGALQVGDRIDMLALARNRVEQLRTDGYPDAALLDQQDTRVLVILGDRESMYRTRL